MLKQGIKKAIKAADTVYAHSDGEVKAERAYKTSDELVRAYNELYKGRKTLTKPRLLELQHINTNREYENFIIALVTLFNQLPVDKIFSKTIQVEPNNTYVPIFEIPTWELDEEEKDTRRLTDSQILAMINHIYCSEGFEQEVVNHINTSIFRPSAWQQFTLTNGKCFVYRDFLAFKSKMMLERYYDVREIIIPSREAVMMIKSLHNRYDNYVNILRYYMEGQAILSFQGTMHEVGAKDYAADVMRDLILKAQKYYKNITSNQKVNGLQKAQLMDFTDQVIGYSLAMLNKVSLIDILETPFMEGINTPDLSLVDTSYDEILNIAKEDVKTLYKI